MEDRSTRNHPDAYRGGFRSTRGFDLTRAGALGILTVCSFPQPLAPGVAMGSQLRPFAAYGLALLALALLVPLIIVIRRWTVGRWMPIAVASVVAVIGLVCTFVLQDGTPAFLAAIALVAIAWAARRTAFRLRHGPTLDAFPPMPPGAPPIAPSPVPTPPRPPALSGPAGAALSMPPVVHIPSCWPTGAHDESRFREPIAVAPRGEPRPPLRALPPPPEPPRDPGVIPLRPRGRGSNDPKR